MPGDARKWLAASTAKLGIKGCMPRLQVAQEIVAASRRQPHKLLLVGGFGGSEYLQASIRSRFGK